MSKVDPLGLLAVLEDGPVRLEPLREDHRDALRALCAEDLAIWQIYSVPYDPEHFDASFTTLLTHPARLPLALLVEGELAGMTAWIDADDKRLSAEIGNTFIAPAHRGGTINPIKKRLMFRHGFACGLKRIYLHVDSRNARSQAACRKVGATYEGTLRNHLITWTGYERDTAVFSVVTRDRERLGL